MIKRNVVILFLCCLVGLLVADISPLNPITGISNAVQFGGRQSVYASGDSIAICYIRYDTLYDQLYPTDTGRLVYATSSNGGQSFQTVPVIARTGFDGSASLFKDGSEVIITYSAGGYIYRAISGDDGVTFTVADSVQGSDRLPITDKYNGDYHSIHTYQDFAPDYYKLEGSSHKFYSSFIDNSITSNGTLAYYWGPDVTY